MSTDKRLLLLNENDNVLVCCQPLSAGDEVTIDGLRVRLSSTVDLGHKLARRNIMKGQLIIRYGVPIGSTISDIQCGEHVHLHNMKSDYIPPHTRDAESNSSKHSEVQV